ncbi:MAG: carboxylesterase/lipase family protein, partial [Dehalococcoidia bacterium]
MRTGLHRVMLRPWVLLTAALLGACVVIVGWPGSSGSEAPVTAQPTCDAEVATEPGVVLTDRGVLRGERSGETYVFRGIPYAAPPVGELRWRPPSEHDCWTGERAATEFGPICPQLNAQREVVGDEDCLTLNVWTPAAPPAAPLPVMLFIHGGGNSQGAGSLPLYDGQRLAEQGDVVLVTLNYRLGPLGFLAHPTLDAESATGASGNYGILDQIAALRWVQRNIAAFGGDPSRVLIFGESGGAVDTCVLLASPLAAGLFQRALMESGACLGPGMQGAAASGPRFVAASPCAGVTDVPACLRGLDTAAVMAVLPPTVSVSGGGGNQYGPVIDGHVLPDAPLRMIQAGTHNHVPFAIGANADETARDVPPIGSEEAYRAALERMLGPSLAPVVAAAYPPAEYGGPRQALVAATSDARFICTARTAARAVAANQSEPVYRYFFTQALRGPAAAFGASHGLELA